MMDGSASGSTQSRDSLIAEIQNFQEIATRFQPSPGDLPSLEGIEVFGESLPVNGIIGGDHLIYVDFKKRFDLEARIHRARDEDDPNKAERLRACQSKAGIVVADVSGHRLTDALVAVMLHQAFLLGSIYEMDYFGEITTRLFENLNNRFHKSSSVRRFVTMIYGEISTAGKFRFLSAAHPPPIIFSRLYDRIVSVSEDRLISFPPIGTMPSKSDIDFKRGTPSALGYKERYAVNEINLLGSGDIMLLYTDGISELVVGGEMFVPGILEGRLRELKDHSASEICRELSGQIRSLPREDDVSLVVIKKA